jgi:hypothetical protein
MPSQSLTLGLIWPLLLSSLEHFLQLSRWKHHLLIEVTLHTKTPPVAVLTATGILISNLEENL